MAAVLVFVGSLAVVGGAFWYGIYRKQKRRREVAQAAAALGLEYSADDPYGLLELPFTLLSEGDGRGCNNVIAGTYEEMPVKEFDYWYYTESTNSKGGTSRTYHYFSCAVTEVQAECPHVAISPESILTRLADHLGFQDIQFESEEFNRRFRVKSSDPKFATDLVDARMMQWLDDGKGWSFEVCGPWLLCSGSRLRAPTLSSLLDVLKGRLRSLRLRKESGRSGGE